MIVGFTGQKGAGKDTAASYLVDKYGFTRIGYADALKDAVVALFDVPHSYIEKYKSDTSCRVQLVRSYNAPGVTDAREYASEMSLRTFLQRMGTEMGREVFGSLFWVDLLKSKLESHKNYVIPDVRFDNETPICDIIIEVTRNNNGNDSHVSEAGVSDDLIDYVIANNDTIEELHKRVEACLREELSNKSYENFAQSESR